ncbi:MAG TPA: hypothetical protein VNW90_00750 [Acetobacteraceae bacterium]|jgi:hypothetical protein|nr:hypothetical protein [Acetobacteraceae bacterium]
MTLPIDPALLHSMIETLAGAWPGGSAEDPRHAARAALEALKPCDLVEAMLAARMIAAHHATMDGYQRAMQPGVSDAEAVRLRNNAVAAARSFDAALRTLEKRRQAPADAPTKPRRHAAPPPPDVPDAVAQIPHRPQFQPRDKSGNPIPRWRWEEMTMAQRRATYGDPDDLETQAIALAEEAAMIEAEQRAAAATQGDSAPAQLSSSLSQ